MYHSLPVQQVSVSVSEYLYVSSQNYAYKTITANIDKMIRPLRFIAYSILWREAD